MRRPRHATIVAYLALFVALGGSSYAAITLKRGSVKGKHIAKNAITGPKVKNGSLRAGDFRAGQLPRGAQGATGPAGPHGVQGVPGPKGDEGDAGPPGAAATNASRFQAVAIPANTAQKIATLPDDRFPLDLEYSCPPAPGTTQGTLSFENDSPDTTFNLFVDQGGANPVYHEELEFQDGSFLTTASGGSWTNWHVQGTSSSDGFTVSIASVHRATDCHVQSQVIPSEDVAGAG